MTETSTCIIATYGNALAWNAWATRAMVSACEQTRPFDAVIRLHLERSTLAEVRNRAAEWADTDWLCFLDADDTLDPGYNAAMLAGTGDVRQPSTSFNGAEPSLLLAVDLEGANYIVVGAFVRREVFSAVGGFFPLDIFEDWDLWKRVARDGAELTACPDAIYRVTERPGSRNHGGWANP